MSARLDSIRLVQGYDDATGYAQIVAHIEADTAADAPAQTYFVGYYLMSGSTMHDISTNDKYCMNSSGTWILQEQSPFKDVYTKSEIDTIIARVDNDIDAALTEAHKANSSIRRMINDGAKNKLNVFAVQSQTINGITWTINTDGTVTASGTATANSFLYLIPNNTNVAYGVETVISGCPAGGSSTTYEIQVAMAGGTTYHDYGDGATIPIDYVYRYFVCAVRSGQTVSSLTFRPMICESWQYQYTPDFVPYSPSNAELAALIRQYHP